MAGPYASSRPIDTATGTLLALVFPTCTTLAYPGADWIVPPTTPTVIIFCSSGMIFARDAKDGVMATMVATSVKNHPSRERH